LLVRDELDRGNVGRQELDREELDGQELDERRLGGQELDREELDGHVLDGQELDRHVLDGQELDNTSVTSSEPQTPAPSAPTKKPAATAPVLGLAAVVGGIAIALAVGHLSHIASHAHTRVALPWIVLAAAFAASEMFLIHIEHRREAVSLTLSAIPIVVGLYTVGPVWLIVARVVGSVTVLVIRRQQPVKLAINATNMALEAAVAGTVFHALTTAHAIGVMTWPAAFAAAIVSDLAQTVVVVSAICIYQRRWEGGLGASMLIGSAARLVDTAVALIIVSVLNAEPAAVGLLAIASAVLVWSHRAHTSLRAKHRQLEELYDFARNINDAVGGDRVIDTVIEQARELMHADRAWVDVDMVAPERAALADGKASIAGPLRDASGTIGTLVVADRWGDVRSFDQSDVRLFAALANHASVALGNSHLVEQLRVQAAEHEHSSLHDPLTGLPNRTLFARRVEEALARGGSLAVLLLDLDRFKDVNDTLGHQHGDVLLREVAGRLRSALRHGDTIARLGGDEFAILLPDVPGMDATMLVARALVGALDQPFALADVVVDIAASIGVAMAPQHGLDPASLLRRADVAMYIAKESQTGAESYDGGRDPHSAERLALVSELRQAIVEGALEVHYQPQIDLMNDDVVGVEALVRWCHPVRGWLPPDEFVPVAERTGLVRPLTHFVLQTALREVARLRAAGGPSRVSVNLSARSLLDPNLVDDVRAMIAAADVPAEALCLELTETSVLIEPRRTIGTLHRLAELGVTVAIDDFGTGQSSFAYLKQLPVGEIKIDKSFVLGMVTDASDEAIVCSIVQLAANLDLPVVAEGVENDEVAARLRSIGCRGAQGFGFSRALPAHELRRWLAERASAKALRVVASA
jgi:diguanylate cyclase (GGDEF)-like protein